jgi:hypothetical protein
MSLKRNTDIDLALLFQDFPQLKGVFENFKHKRKPMKEILLKERFYSNEFDISDYAKLLTIKKVHNDLKIKVLFAHFSPFLYEVEGLGLPTYFKSAFPNCIVDFTYDKGMRSSKVYRIKNEGLAVKVNSRKCLEDSYDLIISRSCALNNMMMRNHEKSTVINSKYKINIKTMSYSPNYVHADYYFDEKDMSPPVDPVYEASANEYFNKFSKEKLVVVPGTIKLAKGQLDLIKNIDKEVLSGNKLIFLGKVEDRSHEVMIRKICKDKDIDYYLPGFLNRNISNYIKHMCKVSIFQYQPHLIPSGYPRSLGESIASKNYSVVSDKIIVPYYFNDCVLAYKSKDFNQMNTTIQKAINETKDESFFKNFKKSISFSDYCCETIEKILDISGIK